MRIDLKGRLGAVKFENGIYTAVVALSQPVAAFDPMRLGEIEVRLTREQGLDLLGRDPWSGDVRIGLVIEVPGVQADAVPRQGADTKESIG